jgi:import inner membrane translocase subunit TIM8
MDKMLEQDPQLMQFVQQMEQEQRLKKQSEKLTVECWDLCVSNPGVAKFDYKTEQCLMNCVDRFIDSSTFLLRQFSGKAQSLAAAESGGHVDETGMSFEDKYSAPKKEEKKSGWW